jgi:eukaryotic-like serine/threonine-protein kinase
MASQEQTVEQLFGAALNRRPEDRRMFLDRVCAGAPELRQRVEELLLADEQSGRFLERKLLVSTVDQSDTAKSTLAPPGGPPNPRVFVPPSASRFQTGQIIAGRFSVVRFIARGGMGEVYEVEDHFLQGVHIALKIILPHIAGDSGSSHRFEREVLLARKVIHPNLCPIYDISRCEEPPPPFLFLTMKLLSGETLASRLQRLPPLSRSETISIFRQMIAGLTAIHAAGVIHRDIKPNNVILDHSGPDLCLSIMDFGLARLYESQTTALTHDFIAGTPGYIAPELLRGAPPSQATDIFALGVLFQQVLTAGHPNVERQGLSTQPSPKRGVADIPPVFIHSVKEFLSEEPARRCVAFKQIQSTFESGDSVTTQKLDDSSRRILTRRKFVVGSALTACAAAGGIVWRWDNVNNRVNQLLHPLPVKRFVALLNWPPTSDTHVKPILDGVIDAISGELARAEAFDRDLFVTAHYVNSGLTSAKQLNELRETLGVNLVLAASGVPRSKDLHLSLSVLDPSSGQLLREKKISWPLAEPISLPEKAVRAAAQLLNVSHYQQSKRAATVDTRSVEAYAAFQAAQTYMKQGNDTGLEAAIGKYKEAVEADPRYVIAFSKLALAYCRFAVLNHSPAALDLARANCETALTLDPNSVEAHLALASVMEQRGDESGALREIAKALTLDPTDPRTMVWQAQIYVRLNRWQDAEDAFHRVLKHRPNNWLAHNELGFLLNAQGKYSEAISEFRAASLAAPGNALAFNNIAAIDLQLGRPGEAIDKLKKSLALKPTALAAATMAAALRSEGQISDALPFAQKSVDLDSGDSTNWLELGDCYSLLKSHGGDAKKAYAKGAQVQREEMETDSTNGPGWILLALCRAKSGMPEGCLSMIDKADSMFAGDLDSQLYKARTLEVLRRREDALNTIAACFKRGATDFQIRLMPDMGPLRKDPRYREILGSDGAEIQSAS